MHVPLLDAANRRRVRGGEFGRRSMRQWWRRRLINLAFLLLLAAVGVGGWYLAHKGFSRAWRTRVAEELRKHGVESSVRRLTLDPFRGLVAQDVRIYDPHNRENALALISEMSLDINYAALLHHQSFLNALNIRGANVSVPLPRVGGGQVKVELRDFRAHIYFPPEQIYISEAEGIFCGLRISATGQLIKRDTYAPGETTPEEWRQRLELVERVAAELNQFTFAGGPPELRVRISGDVAQLEEAHIEATLRGERIQRGEYEFRSLNAAAEWRDQRLNLTRWQWDDAGGSFRGQAEYRRAQARADFQAHSTIALKPLLSAFGFGELLADAGFSSAPVLDLSGSADFAARVPRFDLIGRIAADNLTYKQIPLTNLAGEFAWDGKRTMLRGVRVRGANSELQLNLLDAPKDFRLDVDSTLNPGITRLLLPPPARKVLDEWEWPRPPVIHLAIRGLNRQPETWSGDGTIALERARFRGVWMNSANADLHFGSGAVSVNNLRVARDEGVGTGAITYDFLKHELRFANVKTTLRPSEVIYWIDPKMARFVVPYKFRHPPNVTTNGVIQFHGGTGDHLLLEVSASSGLDYVFLGKTLPLDHVGARLLFTNDRLQIENVEASLFSGAVRGGVDISLAKGDPHYHALLNVEGIDFPKLTDLYFKYETAHGRLSGDYDFFGLGDDARTMHGEGKLLVREGDVFAIPIFGPLSGFLASIFPGAGYSIAHEASAAFVIRNGVIHTDDFKVSGKLFGMIGHGNLFFLDDKLDFDMRINPSGPGVLLTPVYKLFEYHADGTLSKPNWHPKHL